MPKPGYAWWHLVLHTKGSWLHGDPRGFRTRQHRIHSSGDYKSPPPSGEHQNLHQYEKEKLKNAVVIPTHLYQIIGQALYLKSSKMNVKTLAISVGPTHAHLQVELENNYKVALKHTAKIKQAASYAVRNALPGSLWARGGKPIAISDLKHQIRVYQYIQTHAKQGDWVWTFQD
ncbi:MAG: hypothetical protein JKX85_05145 [Phycisphaeraceae bacterium]|nr:hypothetical protein [Phycisphaeraceae bacterium]